MPVLAHADIAEDFSSYELRRVGLLPFQGEGLGAEDAQGLQLSLYSELSQATPFEMVLLTPADLEEIEASEPYRRGWYKPKTIIDIAKRYSVDAVLFGTVMQRLTFPPQVLALSVDVVSAETGLVIWNGRVHLDANDPRVLRGVQLYYEHDADESAGSPPWQTGLLSPERFARFAAFQIACLL
jgi:hypothetical protein